MIFSDLSLKRAREIERDSKRIMKTSRGTKIGYPRCLEFPFRGTFYHSELGDLFSTRVCDRWSGEGAKDPQEVKLVRKLFLIIVNRKLLVWIPTFSNATLGSVSGLKRQLMAG